MLLSISGLSADDAQIEAKLRSWTKELDDMRASGNNLAASQESFAADVALLGFCEKQKSIPERALKELKELNCVDENGNILPTVCEMLQKYLAEEATTQK